MGEVIKAAQLTKSYGKLLAVDKITLSVKRGTVFGLPSANGAGKSTTIECLLGTKMPDSGTVSILGMNPRKDRKQLFEHVGVQFQESNYQEKITVGELCEVTASLYKTTADYLTLLKQFGIENKIKKLVSELSGGERQRLFIVLALIPDPEVVFLDELTTGLDARARRDVWKSLSELKSQGLTILLTSHFMDEVSDYRSKKVLKRFQVTPVSPARILMVQVAIYTLYSLVSLVLLYVVAKLFFGYSFSGSWLHFIGGYVLVMLSIFSIGMMVGGIAPNTKIAGVIASILYFPMLIFSGATLPYEVMPVALQKAADVLPLTQGIKLLKSASLGLPIGDMTLPFIVMAGLAIICMAFQSSFSSGSSLLSTCNRTNRLLASLFVVLELPFRTSLSGACETRFWVAALSSSNLECPLFYENETLGGI